MLEDRPHRSRLLTEYSQNCSRLALVLAIAAALVGPAAGARAQNRGPERDKWQRPAEVMDELGIHAGSVVADVGCGRGYFTFQVAARVGAQGKVYAEDINDEPLDSVRSQAKKENLAQVETVLGTAEDPKLPADSIDVVLAMNTFHEWHQYDDMLQHLYEALKPGGLFGLIDGAADPGEPRATYYAEHRMPQAMERADVERHGFRFVRQERGFTEPEDHKEFYFLIFEKPAPPVKTSEDGGRL